MVKFRVIYFDFNYASEMTNMAEIVRICSLILISIMQFNFQKPSMAEVVGMYGSILI